MNIQKFISFLNKRNGWNIDGAYYSNVDEWRQWWRGYYQPFHQRTEQLLTGAQSKRDMFSLRMAKQVCEDWATLLLNDKTTVSVSDEKTGEWLHGGEAAQQLGGLLGSLDFWTNSNGLVEQAMRSGAGAFVLSAENAKVDNGAFVADAGAQLQLDYLPAECILPLTVRHGVVTEAAFVSELMVEGRPCAYLQTHLLKNGEYVIYNQYFEANNTDTDAEDYREAPRPDGMAAQVRTGSVVPWFAVFTPAGNKNISGGAGLGVAVFAEAVDAIKMADLAFDNYSMDIYLGGKKVFYNKDLCETVYSTDTDGNVISRKVAPDDVRQQLFVQASASDPDAPADWHEYNPDLRTAENSQAVQNALDYISFKTGLGTHHYQFDSGAVATATQYAGDRQDMIQHAERHHTRIEAALVKIVRAIIYAGKTVCGAAVNPDCDITIGWDDSYISSAETRRQQDQQDALNGFIPKWRYNVEWRGMSEAEAKQAVQDAMDETASGSAASLGDLFSGA